MNLTIKARIESIRRGEVPEGYKRTKIGIVPNEWSVHFLLKHLKESRLPGSNGRMAKKLTVKLWNRGVSEKREVHNGSENTVYYRRKAGQLIYSKLDFLNCAFGIIPKELDNYESTADLPCFDITDVNPYFLLTYITQKNFYAHLGMIADGGRKARRVNPEEMLKFPLIYPPIDEQQKIAEILSVQDRVIELKEKLLAEKQKQKKYLMQQLLAGKKRLPGFSGEWKKSLLGDLFRERVETNCTELRLLAITGGQGVIPRDELELKDNSSEDKSKYKKICVGDIGYNTMRMWQGVSAFSNYEGIVSPAYTILMPNSEIDAKFFAYLFKLPSMVFLFYRYSQGLVDDTRNLKYKNLGRIRVLFPCDRKEQTVIAEILSTADKEIELLKKDIEQEKLKKKSLMQLLLTGIVRVSA